MEGEHSHARQQGPKGTEGRMALFFLDPQNPLLAFPRADKLIQTKRFGEGAPYKAALALLSLSLEQTENKGQNVN